MRSSLTPRERIRAGFLNQPVDIVPLHCRLRMAPLEAQYQWVRDLGWGVVDAPASVLEQYVGCSDVWASEQQNGRACRRRTVMTPAGSLSALETTNAAGGTAPLEHLFKDEKDYPALLAMIRSLHYEPAYAQWATAQDRLGDLGYAYAWVGYDPMHEIMVRLMGVETFCYEWADNQDRVLELYHALREKHREMFRIVAAGPAELVVYGGNIQPTVVGRERFAAYYVPIYQEFGEMLHAAGKRFGAHLDDATGHLKDLIADCPWDVIEAWAVAPDGDMSVAEARAIWPGRVLSLNFPSKLHHAPEADVRSATRRFIAEAGSGPGLLISLTEDFPREVETTFFRAIAEAVQGGV